MRPEELAFQLGISPKTLRAWLRREYPRTPGQHGAAWDLTDEQVSKARARFGVGGVSPVRSMPSKSTKPASPSRAGSDEAYVIDLCDRILGQTALRQHRFPWLQGDPGVNGQTVCLPVDAYYSTLGVVVEYREIQHDKPVPHFDKRHTVSGVNRGTQRRIYDERREAEIPKNGLRLIIVRPSQLSADSQGRLKRNEDADFASLRALLAEVM